MHALKSATLAICACLALPVGAIAEGDPKPGFMDLITPDAIAGSVASVAISALRTQMEVEYDHMETDVMRGTVALSGVTLRPQLSYDRARQCEITLARVRFDIGKHRPLLAASNVSATAIGAKANIACLERDIGLMLRSAGYAEIEVDRLVYEMDYFHGSGEIRTNISATINDLATVDVAMSGAILPRLDRYGYAGDPAVRLHRAVLGVQDHGGWARLSQLMPENLRQPDIIRGIGTEELTNMLSQNGTRALTSTERRFIDDLMDHVARFVREPGEITIEAELPVGGIVIEPEVYQSPEELLQALAPDARSAPLAQSQLISSDLLSRTNGELTRAERLELAGALLEGRGLPRAEALVPELLAQMVDATSADGAQAALLTARALMPHDARSAYLHALIASEARLPEAVPLLDALEARMTTVAVIETQKAYLDDSDAVVGIDALPADGDVREVRRMALARFTGLGAARSYRLAYYYALIAEAAGDIGARPLREDIEARFANRGEDVTEMWMQTRAKLQELALKDWIELDLAARFGRSD
ncbi:hypothetical protein [Roseovarius pelagicus]|uniref:Sel1 repeat family protein n=1 Tax=Roseovarius pelagicus TaxID=2980108 RepID=A0ABY6D931_9RHOB|nr:hypothetical protein [Roseovarius pelagicus]UXX82110.1 hypothetical protein N7U68_13465 [Roseovarius pelagicus]